MLQQMMGVGRILKMGVGGAATNINQSSSNLLPTAVLCILGKAQLAFCNIFLKDLKKIKQ